MAFMRLVTAGAALLFLGTTGAWASPAAFLTKAIEGDNSEMRLGQLAAERAEKPSIRAFGRMLERDHRAARADAVRVARRHGVSATTAMAPEAAVERRKLVRLRGRAFDREFARYMVRDHRKDIADFEKEVASRDPADVRSLARRTLPALRKHLTTAQAAG
ncbi:MAG: hypothetical protein JWL96_1040 [Sphingomonas bacterium]|uniref:DUF4142 domain-containing protein n=1 Tax=Sphingomonas bacterium TaxID=1895847 RepID=UPI002633850A|nr:DUF4142 domain-containing protein [Sphingomonas bacterium]MDB5708970.1 hypothetical protein [Sphingomonas bacterium]